MELVITDVTEQRRNQQRRSIYVNGEFLLGVSEETYVRFALYRGRKLTEAEIEEITAADELYRAKQTALRLIGIRMRSRREMTGKLTEREFSEATIEATLAFLEEYGMLDDRAFARALVHSQLLRRPIGKRRLTEQLRKHGLTPPAIEEALDDAGGADADLANARTAARKRAATLRTDDPRKWDRTMANFLAARGFTWETIDRVVREFRAERADAANESTAYQDESGDDEA